MAEERDDEDSELAELVGYLRHRGKWWLLPLLAALVVLSGLLALSTTGVGPFVYALF